MPLNQWEDKVWGRTRCTNESLVYSHHELELVKGGYCSFHYHEHRSNIFRVTKGRVRIVWAYGWKVHFKDLVAGDSFVMPSLVTHQFQVIESGAMLEEYRPERGGLVRLDDIIRLSVGGIAPEGYKLNSEYGEVLVNGNSWKGLL